MSELRTLFPSPTYATVTSRRSGPFFSLIVRISARPWHGCVRSESPLITGIDASSARTPRSSRVRWCAARPRRPCGSQRARHRQRSRGDRDRPPAVRDTRSDRPARVMPTSNESRVRRLGFSKICASVRPARSGSRRERAALSADERSSRRRETRRDRDRRSRRSGARAPTTAIRARGARDADAARRDRRAHAPRVQRRGGSCPVSATGHAARSTCR